MTTEMGWEREGCIYSRSCLTLSPSKAFAQLLYLKWALMPYATFFGIRQEGPHLLVMLILLKTFIQLIGYIENHHISRCPYAPLLSADDGMIDRPDRSLGFEW